MGRRLCGRSHEGRPLVIFVNDNEFDWLLWAFRLHSVKKSSRQFGDVRVGIRIAWITIFTYIILPALRCANIPIGRQFGASAGP